LGFHPVVAVDRLVQELERDSYIQEKQYTKQHKNTKSTKQKTKIQNKKTNIKKIFKKHNSSN
jgi:hypothetical protein